MKKKSPVEYVMKKGKHEKNVKEWLVVSQGAGASRARLLWQRGRPMLRPSEEAAGKSKDAGFFFFWRMGLLVEGNAWPQLSNTLATCTYALHPCSLAQFEQHS